MMSGGGGGDAERWLATAERLLVSGDLTGSKTYAIRACEADHSLVDHAELILAVADTLIAGESRIRGNISDLPDWYAVLRLVRLTHNPELVATQYNRLAVLLNPTRNRFPYSSEAFKLISDAWYVLSDPSRKAVYDRDLHLSQFEQLGPLGFQLFNQPPPQQQQQQQSPHQSQTASYQNQQLPFQLQQQPQQHPHFSSQAQQQRSQQYDQQLMQEQQQASWRQQFGQEQHSDTIRTSGGGSGRDWKQPVQEERLINLNNATERVQPSRRFAEPERPPSLSFRTSSNTAPSTDLTWRSKTTPTSEIAPWQSSETARQFQPSRSSETAQLSLLTPVSDPPHVSQSGRSTQSHLVSKPQPVAKPFPMSQPQLNSNPFPVSQPPSASKPFPMSQSSQKSKPFMASQPPQNSMFPVSQPPLTSKQFPMSQPVAKPSSNSNPSQLSSISNPFPVSQQPFTAKPFPVSQPPSTSKTFPVSQPQSTSKPFPVSQPQPASKSFPVSQPQPASKPFPMSQPPSASNSFSVSQPSQSLQSTHPSQPPEPSSYPSTLPPVFNSTQSFQQPPPVSTTPSPAPAPAPAPAFSTNPSPPVSQPNWVPNQTPPTEHTPKTGVASSDTNPKVPSFWTTCPYCFVLYEYPSFYEESVLKCQTKSCRRAFQAVKVPSPPSVTEEEDSYYCCWGFYPIGFTEPPKIPVSDLPRPAPKKPSPKVYYYDVDVDDEDDSYLDDDDDDDDDDDWRISGTYKRKNAKQSKEKSSTKPKVRKPRKAIEDD